MMSQAVIFGLVVKLIQILEYSIPPLRVSDKIRIRFQQPPLSSSDR